MDCAALLCLEIRLGGGPSSSRDCVEPSGEVPTAATALEVGRRVENTVERLITMVGYLEGLDDDVDCPAFVVGRAVDADRPIEFAHVHVVFGLDLHNLIERTLEHVSRITETERVPGRYETVS